jgi:signal transduction histidine kinase
VDNPLEKALGEGVAVGLANPTNLISKGGIRFPIDDSAAPLKNEHGKLIGAVLVFRDISPRRRFERQLEEAVSALQRSNRELQQFVNGAAHDLRSPLNVIRNMTQLLSLKFSEKLDHEDKELIGYIAKAVTRMTHFLEDLLAFAHASHFEAYSAALLPLNAVLTETLHILNDEIVQSGGEITADSLPEVKANETHMVQLFQNLISNALKYRNARPRIHISAKQENGQWVFSITDNGIGIPCMPIKYSNPFIGCTVMSTREPALGLRHAKKLSRAMGAESGWSLNWVAGRDFLLLFQ